MTSTAIGLWRGTILRVMSGVRSAVCGRLGVGWAWPSSASTCMQQVGTMGVLRCRLWRGERARGREGVSREILAPPPGMTLTSTSGRRWPPWPREGRGWVWSLSTDICMQLEVLMMLLLWTQLRGGQEFCHYPMEFDTVLSLILLLFRNVLVGMVILWWTV